MSGGGMFADLVLEGGGVKGIALVGAISVLEERGYQFRRVAGTLADLRYDDPGRPPHPEYAYRLVVMTCDISRGCLRRLPWEYGCYGLPPGGQPVVDAVRASVSIPFFYKPARLTDVDGRDCWLVDGAVLSRVSTGVFDAPPPLEPRWPTFGIKLGTAPRPVSEVRNTVTMSRAMVKTMTGFYDRSHIDDAAAAARTIV